MIKLFFEIKKGEIWRFETKEYFIDPDGIYHFIDRKTGQERQYHKSLYRGKEVF